MSIKQKTDFSILNSLPSKNRDAVGSCAHKEINVVEEVQRELYENEENKKRIFKYGKYLNAGSDEGEAKLIEDYKAINRIVDIYVEMRQRTGNIEIKEGEDKNIVFLEMLLTGKVDNLPVNIEKSKKKKIRSSNKAPP